MKLFVAIHREYDRYWRWIVVLSGDYERFAGNRAPFRSPGDASVGKALGLQGHAHDTASIRERSSERAVSAETNRLRAIVTAYNQGDSSSATITSGKDRPCLQPSMIF